MNQPITVAKTLSPAKILYRIINYGGLALIVVLSSLGIQFQGIMQTAAGTIGALGKGFIEPDFSYLANLTIDGLPFALVETIAISIAGTFVSALLSIPLALLASENIVGKKVALVGKFLVTAIRTFPELILALIFISVVGPGAPAGILAIGIHSVGMLGKLFSEAIESMDMGSKEALDSLGARPLETLVRGMLPELAPEFISYTLYRFEINVRAAATLGLVGAGGIGAPLIFAIMSRAWSRVGIIMLALIAVVTLIDLLSGALRKRLV